MSSNGQGQVDPGSTPALSWQLGDIPSCGAGQQTAHTIVEDVLCFGTTTQPGEDALTPTCNSHSALHQPAVIDLTGETSPPQGFMAADTATFLQQSHTKPRATWASALRSMAQPAAATSDRDCASPSASDLRGSRPIERSLHPSSHVAIKPESLSAAAAVTSHDKMQPHAQRDPHHQRQCLSQNQHHATLPSNNAEDGMNQPQGRMAALNSHEGSHRGFRHLCTSSPVTSGAAVVDSQRKHHSQVCPVNRPAIGCPGRQVTPLPQADPSHRGHVTASSHLPGVLPGGHDTLAKIECVAAASPSGLSIAQLGPARASSDLQLNALQPASLPQTAATAASDAHSNGETDPCQGNLHARAQAMDASAQAAEIIPPATAGHASSHLLHPCSQNNTAGDGLAGNTISPAAPKSSQPLSGKIAQLGQSLDPRRQPRAAAEDCRRAAAGLQALAVATMQRSNSPSLPAGASHAMTDAAHSADRALPIGGVDVGIDATVVRHKAAPALDNSQPRDGPRTSSAMPLDAVQSLDSSESLSQYQSGDEGLLQANDESTPETSSSLPEQMHMADDAAELQNCTVEASHAPGRHRSAKRSRYSPENSDEGKVAGGGLQAARRVRARRRYTSSAEAKRALKQDIEAAGIACSQKHCK